MRHILLITDHPLKSSQSESEEKLADEIISNCSRVQIQVNIIGVADSLSFRLTDRTKGSWQPISSEAGDKPTISEVLGRHLLKIDGIIREVAKHIAETCKPMVDVIFMLDSSDSMSDKSDGIRDALPIFAEMFEKSRLNYQFSAIRFYAASGGGESRVIVSQPPLSIDEIKKLLRLPKTGDEHLLDAIVEGIPKLKTRPESKVSLVIFTDEPSTTAQGSDTTDRTSEAMAVCKSRNIQVNIIGASALGAIGSKTHIIGTRSFGAVESKSFATDFQIIAPQATAGIRFAIPGGDTTPSERR